MRDSAMLVLVVLVTLSGCQIPAVKSESEHDYNAWSIENVVMWVCIGVLAGVLYAMLQEPPEDS